MATNTNFKVKNGLDVSGTMSANSIVVTSNTIVSNLNADLLDGQHGSYYAPLASPTFTGTVSGITKTMVGLGSVDNTADVNKPISTATQTALNLKADKSIVISAGSGLVGGGDLSASRTISLASSGATANTYGSSSAIPVLSIDTYGRVTSANTVAVNIPSGALTFTGDVTGSGSTGSTTTLILASSGVTAGTYKSVTVDAKGRVTGGTNPTTLAGYGITDAAASTHTHVLSLTDVPDAWVKKSVRVATTANITLSAPQTIDGIAVVAGDRVLVKDQTAQATNGIYVVQAATWTRATDADTISELSGACVNVDSGTVNGGFRFDTDLKLTDVLGTTAVVFAKVFDTTDSASTNTANKLVLRDASGNFSAGTITATLSGNAATATKLATARTINGTSFDGTANITIVDSTKEPTITAGTTAQYWRGDKTWQTLSIPTTLPASDVYAWAKASVKPTYTYSEVGAPSTTGTNASGTWGINVTGNAATATNSDQLDGQHGSYYQAALVSGTNIKTINSSSILGSGNLKVTPTWAVVQANTSITSGDYVFVDTTSSSITITLPSTPALSDTVKIVDYAGTFATNNCTIARNSSKIMSLSEDLIISTNNASVQLTYINSTVGWKIN